MDQHSIDLGGQRECLLRPTDAATLGVAGMVLVVLDGADPDRGASGRLVGVSLLLAATLADAVYNVRGAAVTRRYDALTVLTWAMTGTLPVWVVVLAWGGVRGELPALDLPATLGVIWVGCVQYTLCFWAWFALIGRAGASLGAVTVAAQPLAGVLVGVLVLAERPGPAALLGALLVVGALLSALTSMGPRFLTTIPPQIHLRDEEDFRSGRPPRSSFRRA